MTINEFKIWLEGYSENIAVSPTPQQWTRIKEKLKEVSEIKAPTYRGADILVGTPYKPEKFYGASPIKLGEVTC